jgi:hypothetical protein
MAAANPPLVPLLAYVASLTLLGVKDQSSIFAGVGCGFAGGLACGSAGGLAGGFVGGLVCGSTGGLAGGLS